MIVAGPDFRVPQPIGQLQLLFIVLAIVTLQNLGYDVVLTSWYRTPAQNAAAGGVMNSLHLSALGLDVVVMGVGNAFASVVGRVSQLFGGSSLQNQAYGQIAAAWRALGPSFQAVAEGDHLHLEIDLNA